MKPMTWICKEHIRNLYAIQNSFDLLSELLILFTTAAKEAIEDLSKHLQQKNWTKVSQVVHSLKSSSGNVGAMELSDRCGQLEEKILSKSYINEKELETDTRKLIHILECNQRENQTIQEALSRGTLSISNL